MNMSLLFFGVIS